MKHFLIEITYTAPPETITQLLPVHRHFLQSGYDQGMLLMSGPINPKTGGVVIARASSLDDLQAFFSFDPYQAKKAATYRYVEFDPVKRQPFLDEWVG